MSIGIIGGSGLYKLDKLQKPEQVAIATPYGAPSSSYLKGEINGAEVIFLARHGDSHNIPPHRINYRANIWGFKELGVGRILSINATGGINKKFTPGSIALLDQILDFTFGARQSTFFEEGRVTHIDFTEPFCRDLKSLVMEAAKTQGIPLINQGVYVCVNGPRLETAQEIKFFASSGADVVGMTLMPEAALAREMELCFCGLSVITNAAAGISEGKLTAKEVVENMKRSLGNVGRIIEALSPLCQREEQRSCGCTNALKDAAI